MDQEKPINIVIGSGALGIFLASDLWDPGLVGLVDVEQPCWPVFVERGKDVRVLDRKLFRHLPSQLVHREHLLANAQNIFVCVTPDVTSSIVNDLAMAPLPKSAVVWFCVNGLVLDWEHIVNTSPDVTLCRVLCHAGFSRTRGNEGTRVVHAGGNRMEWGVLRGRAPETPKTQTLVWDFCENISRREMEKFFINIVLGAIAGDSLVSNGDVLHMLPEPELERVAQNYCDVFAGGGMNVESLTTSFQKTARDTSANVNSLSLAKNRGHVAPWNALLAQLRYWCEKSDNVMAGRDLWNFATQRRGN